MIEQTTYIYDIQALVDNALKPPEVERVRSFIQRNATARQYYETLLRQKNLITYWALMTRQAQK